MVLILKIPVTFGLVPKLILTISFSLSPEFSKHLKLGPTSIAGTKLIKQNHQS